LHVAPHDLVASGSTSIAGDPFPCARPLVYRTSAPARFTCTAVAETNAARMLSPTYVIDAPSA
jgi:hypothetical protein